MFGTFRFLLAVCVLISHVFEPMSFNVGICAVINFFMISGYVNGYLMRTRYRRSSNSALRFYLDRFLRIFPQFFLWMVITQIALLEFDFHYYAFRYEPTVDRFLLNLSLIPLNYFMFLPDLAGYQLIPAAWSLSLEEQFYWIFPLAIYKRTVENGIMLISFVLFVVAVFGFIHTEIWGYRLLPGMLFTFLIGKRLSDYRLSKQWRELILPMLIYVICAVLFTLIWKRAEWLYGRNREVLTGVLIGMPTLFVLSGLQRMRWDDLIGRTAYGIFLSHVLIMNFMIYFKLFLPWPAIFTTTLIAFATAAGAAANFAIDNFFRKYQIKLRSPD